MDGPADRKDLPPRDPRDETGTPDDAAQTPCAFLAVDAGLRTGLAGFDRSGRLLWCRSQHLPDMTRLKRFIRGELAVLPDLEQVVLEGGGDVARAWQRETQRLAGVGFMVISAEEWREAFLHPRERTGGRKAKDTAGILARRVAVWSGGRRPVTLRHDAAEAVMAGFYGVWRKGWLKVSPLDVLR